jgi:predicted extracellular nuclease
MGSPTIVGFQEVENISVLEDVSQHDFIEAFDYLPVLVEGMDSRGIDVGYLVRGDQVELLSVTQHPAPEGLTSRPPLLIEVSLKQDPQRKIYVINNHFTSMAAGELATEPQRSGQASWNLEVIAAIIQEDPSAEVAVIGDLNSFYDSPPLDILRNGGLNHVYEFGVVEMPYTYIYQGESETLDHILLTPSLHSDITRVHILHTNADYPSFDPGDNSPLGLSDHDPVVVVFSLE